MSIEFENITDPDVIGTANVVFPRYGVRAADITDYGFARMPRYSVLMGEALSMAAAIAMPRYAARAADGDNGVATMPRYGASASSFSPPEINEAFVRFPRYT